MDNSYNPSSHLPGHLGMRPNDQFLRQTPTLSPNILLRFPTPPAPIPYNNTPMNSQWPNSMSSNKCKYKLYCFQQRNRRNPCPFLLVWWQSVGPYDPYRTTYQDYGPPKHQFFPTPNLYHIQPTIYNQVCFF